MITEKQKEAICNTLGKQYSKKIIPHLEKKGIKPVKSQFFTPQIIQNIVNGIAANDYLHVEIEILKLTKATARRKIKHENRLKSLQ